MTEHTKGRLRVGDPTNVPPVSAKEIAEGPHKLDAIDIPGYESVDMGKAYTRANASRLVACWNACEGIDDPEAYLAAAHRLTQRHDLREFEEIEAERDELIGALRACVDVAKSWHGVPAWDIYYDCSPEMKPVREALAKHAPKVPA